MPLYDISVAICAALHRFPGDPPVRLQPCPPPDEGPAFRVTRLCCGSHAGTHVDAPAHLLADGATVDALPLEVLVGPCLVLDLTGRPGPIDAAALRRLHLKGQRRILLRTGNSELWERPAFTAAYSALTTDAAAYLAQIGVGLLGIDYLSVEPCDGDGEVHRLLLQAGVVILEGLNLAAVERGEYELLCLPLKLAGGDGAPCRAVLRRPETPKTHPEHHTRWPL